MRALLVRHRHSACVETAPFGQQEGWKAAKPSWEIGCHYDTIILCSILREIFGLRRGPRLNYVLKGFKGSRSQVPHCRFATSHHSDFAAFPASGSRNPYLYIEERERHDVLKRFKGASSYKFGRDLFRFCGLRPKVALWPDLPLCGIPSIRISECVSL